jgi:hypothetical protein
MCSNVKPNIEQRAQLRACPTKSCPSYKTKKSLFFYTCCRDAYVFCAACELRGPVRESKDKAIKSWNAVAKISVA